MTIASPTRGTQIASDSDDTATVDRTLSGMTTTSAVEKYSMSDRAFRATSALAFIAGSALIVDTVTISVINRSFDPLDSILFLVGFIGMLIATGTFAIYLTRNQRGVKRVGFAVGVSDLAAASVSV